MDIKLIVMKPNLTQKGQPLKKYWAQSYLIIYPSLSFFNIKLNPFCLCTSFVFFNMSACELDSSHNLNDLYFGSYSVRITWEPEFGDQSS